MTNLPRELTEAQQEDIQEPLKQYRPKRIFSKSEFEIWQTHLDEY